MTAKIGKKEGKESETEGPREITFKCRFCGMSKLLEEMVVLARFFPPLVACRDCERKMR